MKGAETFASEVPNPVPFALVDAFGEGPFTGNPAGVCLMNGTASEGWMAAVAAEIGASETAFLRRAGDGWSLRWFTPEVEVDLCGHATLAAAHLLIGSGETVRFETRSGLLLAHRGSDGRLTLDFPRLDVTETRADERVAAALGEEPIWLGRTADDLLCVLESPDAVERATPHMDSVTQLTRRGLAVTRRGDETPTSPHGSSHPLPACRRIR